MLVHFAKETLIVSTMPNASMANVSVVTVSRLMELLVSTLMNANQILVDGFRYAPIYLAVIAVNAKSASSENRRQHRAKVTHIE